MFCREKRFEVNRVFLVVSLYKNIFVVCCNIFVLVLALGIQLKNSFLVVASILKMLKIAVY